MALDTLSRNLLLTDYRFESFPASQTSSEEAFDLCEQALKLKEDESGYYAKACCYARQGQAELAIEALKQAIEYAAHRCRLEAKYNPDFDCLRDNEQFQAALLHKEGLRTGETW